MHQYHDFIILTAPPASGKTYWISDFAKGQPDNEIMVISPLRALADEMSFLFGSNVTIETPESWLKCKKKTPIVIFDEFHLLFYWGSSFRPVMWEVFFELSQNSQLFIALTATLSQDMKSQIELFHHHFDHVWWFNYGNQKLKNVPTAYLKLPSKKMMNRLMHLESPRSEGVKLVFCQYRQEVFQLAEKLQQKHFNVWTCVGGEAKAFSKQTKYLNPPDFIICTTVLSHGVNLPKITKIYFLYEVKNLDFWIQMVARGGRKGESFKVFALENPTGITWNRCINLLAILHLRLRMLIKQTNQQFIECFLKE